MDSGHGPVPGVGCCLRPPAESDSIDVHLVTHEAVHSGRTPIRLTRSLTARRRAAGFIAAALIGGLYPALAAAVLGFGLLNYYFTPPLYRFTIAERETCSLARIRAVTRRQGDADPGGTVGIGRFDIDIGRRTGQSTVDPTEALHLTRTEWQLLTALVRKRASHNGPQ
jgi:hypothetical protein